MRSSFHSLYILPYIIPSFDLIGSPLRSSISLTVSWGFVQRISGDKIAVLFDDMSPWEKLVTFPLKVVKEDTTGPQFYKMK